MTERGTPDVTQEGIELGGHPALKFSAHAAQVLATMSDKTVQVCHADGTCLDFDLVDAIQLAAMLNSAVTFLGDGKPFINTPEVVLVRDWAAGADRDYPKYDEDGNHSDWLDGVHYGIKRVIRCIDDQSWVPREMRGTKLDR